jgi:uncharacterized protein YraI
LKRWILILAMLSSFACSVSSNVVNVVTPVPSSTATITPEKAATITSTPTERTVAANILEIRAGPGEGYGNVGYAHHGQAFVVLETVITEDWCQQWSRISYDPDKWLCSRWLNGVPTKGR